MSVKTVGDRFPVDKSESLLYSHWSEGIMVG